MRESYWRDGGESGHQGRGELRRTPMTLRSEMYFCVLESSSGSGRGVLAAIRRALSASRAMLKDPGRGTADRKYQKVPKTIALGLCETAYV
jgi:hypothetical protein